MRRHPSSTKECLEAPLDDCFIPSTCQDCAKCPWLLLLITVLHQLGCIVVLYLIVRADNHKLGPCSNIHWNSKTLVGWCQQRRKPPQKGLMPLSSLPCRSWLGHEQSRSRLGYWSQRASPRPFQKGYPQRHTLWHHSCMSPDSLEVPHCLRENR